MRLVINNSESHLSASEEGATMKVRLKDRLVILSAESDEERASITQWLAPVEGHVFHLIRQDGQTFRLASLGRRQDACREPINVTSQSPDVAIQLISNFAHTPFTLDGRAYASIEGFWQCLKYPDDESRLAIARLHGMEARMARAGAVEAPSIEYEGRAIRVGTWDHWQLMLRACRAKFMQHTEARRALLSTGERPLTHKTRKDSRTIPGVVMADIWMRVRRELAEDGKADRSEPATLDE
jgi:predicted NAD-dependent protein-ADP-ribosyltransferase YbiA (DUF1768 family)